MTLLDEEEGVLEAVPPTTRRRRRRRRARGGAVVVAIVVPERSFKGSMYVYIRSEESDRSKCAASTSPVLCWSSFFVEL